MFDKDTNESSNKQKTISLWYTFWWELSSLFRESVCMACDCSLFNDKCINCGKNDNNIYHTTHNYCNTQRECTYCGLTKNKLSTYPVYIKCSSDYCNQYHWHLHQVYHAYYQQYQKALEYTTEESKIILDTKSFLMNIYIFIISILMIPCIVINFVFSIVHLIVYRAYVRTYLFTKYYNTDSSLKDFHKDHNNDNDNEKCNSEFLTEFFTMNIIKKILYCVYYIFHFIYNDTLTNISNDYDYKIIVYLIELICMTVTKLPQLLLLIIIYMTLYIYVMIRMILYNNTLTQLCSPFFGTLTSEYPISFKSYDEIYDEIYCYDDNNNKGNDTILLNDINILHIIFRIITSPIIILFGYLIGFINIILVTFLGLYIQTDNRILTNFERIIFYKTNVIYDPILELFYGFCRYISMTGMNIYDVIMYFLYITFVVPFLRIVNVVCKETYYVLVMLIILFEEKLIVFFNKIENIRHKLHNIMSRYIN